MKAQMIYIYIYTKIVKLALPCVIYNLIYGIIIIVLHSAGFSIGGEFNLFNVIVTPFTYGSAFLLNCPDWFVGQLFFVEIINVILRKCIRGKEKVFDIAVCVILIAISCINIYISRNYMVNEYLLLLFRTIYCMSWYEIGKLYHARIEKFDQINNEIYFTAVFLIQLMLLVLNQGNIGGSVVRFNFREIYIVCVYLSAMTGIAFWLRICRILAPICMKSRFLLYLSRHTFVILENHIMAFFVVNSVMCGIKEKISGMILFDEERYHAEYLYRAALVSGDERFNIIYLLAGIIMPLVLLAIWENVKNRLVNHKSIVLGG